MICKNCGKEIPEDSLFCPFCGKKYEIIQPLVYTEQTAQNLSTASEEKKENFLSSNVTKMAIIILLVTSLIINVYYMGFVVPNHKNNISDMQTEITEKNSKITAYETSIKKLEKTEKKYNDLIAKIKTGVGADNANFSCSDYVVYMKKGATKKITLTTMLSSMYVYNSESNRSVAYVTFDDNQWYGNTTKLTLHASSEGLCMITFSNSKSNYKFKVLVIVE